MTIDNMVFTSHDIIPMSHKSITQQSYLSNETVLFITSPFQIAYRGILWFQGFWQDKFGI